jgi:hypothetical protein
MYFDATIALISISILTSEHYLHPSHRTGHSSQPLRYLSTLPSRSKSIVSVTFLLQHFVVLELFTREQQTVAQISQRKFSWTYCSTKVSSSLQILKLWAARPCRIKVLENVSTLRCIGRPCERGRQPRLRSTMDDQFFSMFTSRRIATSHLRAYVWPCGAVAARAIRLTNRRVTT